MGGMDNIDTTAAMDEEKHTLARIRSLPPIVLRIEEADYAAVAVDPTA